MAAGSLLGPILLAEALFNRMSVGNDVLRPDANDPGACC